MVSSRKLKSKSKKALGIQKKSISKKHTTKDEIAMEVDGEIVKNTKDNIKKLIKERKQHQRWKDNEEHPDVPEPKSEVTKHNPSREGRGNLKVVDKTRLTHLTSESGNGVVRGHRMTKKALKKMDKAKKRAIKEKEEKNSKMES
uniref:Ribosome biogenesis protein NOP53 n=1 Tax=Strongyloides venezuelensis TaxID=75913 RepID=A0A0K0FKC0_STRVS